MKILDTNILVRLAVGASTSEEFNELTNDEQVYIDSSVLAELIYVLIKVYTFSKTDVCSFCLSILQNADVFTNEALTLAVNLYSLNNLDFVDCIVIALAIKNSSYIVTKDKKLLKIFEKEKDRASK